MKDLKVYERNIKAEILEGLEAAWEMRMANKYNVGEGRGIKYTELEIEKRISEANAYIRGIYLTLALTGLELSKEFKIFLHSLPDDCKVIHE